LAAGLCPDPLEELKRSPTPPSRNKGDLLLRGGEGKGGDGRGKGGEGEGEGEGEPCSKVLGGIDAPDRSSAVICGVQTDQAQMICGVEAKRIKGQGRYKPFSAKFWHSCLPPSEYK